MNDRLATALLFYMLSHEHFYIGVCRAYAGDTEFFDKYIGYIG